jgi:hypothetical protein
MWVNTLGGSSPPVSDLMWTVRIALNNSWVRSINWLHSFLFCLTVCHDWLRFMVAADSLTLYLHIFQERLSCVWDGLQQGALQTAGKDSYSICTDTQTCCNVVQLNLSDGGLGGHPVRWIKGLDRHCYFILCAHVNFLLLATVHLLHRRCDTHIWCRTWPHQMIWSNEQLYLRDVGKSAGLHLRSLFNNRGLTYICHETVISSHALPMHTMV